MRLSLPYHPAGWQRLVQRLAATRTGSALVAPILHRLDAPFIRMSNGRITLTSLLTGLPVVTLTTLGARSGQPRSVPVVAIPLETGEVQNIILIASNFGRKQHPAWYHNLKAHPQATLSLNGFEGSYLAHEAVGEEREACWQRAAFLYGGYNAYRNRASQRTIGVFVLTPEE